MPRAPGLRAPWPWGWPWPWRWPWPWLWLWLWLWLCALLGGPARCAPACPGPCRCRGDGDGDGVRLAADCAELGLSKVPAGLAPLTAHLDLSMNNLTELQPGGFRHLRFLEELRLSGNRLSHIPGGAFSGLQGLKVLMLQNNQLTGIPAEALRQLPSLQSLRLDANRISLVPETSFEGLPGLRHLWLDDNALAEVPVGALGRLPALQAMTLALNRIRHVPDFAFRNLSSLVVLHLHNNRIQRLGTHSLEGLHSLETLDLNHNDLREFPMAIRTLGRLQELGFHDNSIRAIPERAFTGNPLLQTIHFYDNPIQSVGRSAFQDLPKLHTLSLNGAAAIEEFPDLTGTTSLETLTLTRAGIRRLPPRMCQQLPRLRVLDLSHNQIEELPSLHRCQKLEEIGLQHNRVWDVRADTFRQLSSLRTLDLSRNSIRSIHPEAFATLRSLVKLDLTDNQLTALPLAGLGGLRHLKLKGNPALSQAFSEDSFPKLRILEVPHAYQCCAFGGGGGGGCAGSFKASGPWDGDGFPLEDEEAPRGPLGLLAGHAESHYDLDLDETEDTKPHPRVQCSPVPGPFKPCEHLFESWGVRLAVWAIVLLSLLGNGRVLLGVLAGGPGPLPPATFAVGALAGANALTGVSWGLLACVDALTFGRFAAYGARWEAGPGCRATGFLAVLGSEAAVLLLALASGQSGGGGVSAAVARGHGKAPALRGGGRGVRAWALGCLALAGLAAALPLASVVGEYGASPLCLPYAPPPEGRPAAVAFAVALGMLNSLCFLAATGAHIRLYCAPRGGRGAAGHGGGGGGGALGRHVARLVLADGLLHCPVAFLGVASGLGLAPVAPEAIKSVLLLVLPLPACLNPLLYLLLAPRPRGDLGRLWPCRGAAPGTLASAAAAARPLEKASCDSTQALVAFSDDVDLVPEASEAGWQPPGPETYGFLLEGTLVSCPRPESPGPEGTRFGNQPPPVDREWPLRAEGATLGGGGAQPSGSAFASHV